MIITVPIVVKIKEQIQTKLGLVCTQHSVTSNYDYYQTSLITGMSSMQDWPETYWSELFFTHFDWHLKELTRLKKGRQDGMEKVFLVL